MRVLLDSVLMIHAHGEAPLHQRLFRALDLVFPGSRYAFELFERDGGYVVETDIEVDESSKSVFFERTAELVKAQSPMFARLAAGDKEPMRLSDCISMRELQRTDLYHEIFRLLHIRHQIGIPIQSRYVMGGITVNRDRGDFSDEDVRNAGLLAPQIATAFEVDRCIGRVQPEVERGGDVDYSGLRELGLSRREAEVMVWMTEAKRDLEIAVILGISVRTVQQHVHAILRKLGAENRTAAVAMVLRLGAVPRVG